MSEDLKARLGGILILAIGIGSGWWFIYKPYQEALAGAPEISYPMKALVLVPMSLIFGLFFLIAGTKIRYRTANGQNFTPLGWILFTVFGAITALFWWWLDTQFKALGYV